MNNFLKKSLVSLKYNTFLHLNLYLDIIPYSFGYSKLILVNVDKDCDTYKEVVIKDTKYKNVEKHYCTYTNVIFYNCVFDKATFKCSNFVNCMFINCIFDTQVSFVYNHFDSVTFLNCSINELSYEISLFSTVNYRGCRVSPKSSYLIPSNNKLSSNKTYLKEVQ